MGSPPKEQRVEQDCECQRVPLTLVVSFIAPRHYERRLGVSTLKLFPVAKRGTELPLSHASAPEIYRNVEQHFCQRGAGVQVVWMRKTYAAADGSAAGGAAGSVSCKPNSVCWNGMRSGVPSRSMAQTGDAR